MVKTIQFKYVVNAFLNILVKGLVSKCPKGFVFIKTR